MNHRLLVTQRLDFDEARGEFRDALDTRWAPFLMGLGLVPVPVPSAVELTRWLDAIGPVHGLLLTGGNDVVSVAPTEANTRRETLERALLGALGHLPTLGVCRGMQLLAELDGFSIARVEGHVATRHPLHETAPAGPWSAYRGLSVNSFHQQGVSGRGAALEVMARAEDGSIEALASASGKRVGILWHPEREATPTAADEALFRSVFS